MQQNAVTFHLTVNGRSGLAEYMSARIVVPSGREICVSYWPAVIKNGKVDPQRSGLFIDGLELQDRDSDDLFCSMMFADLTGRYPYEIEGFMEPNQDFAPFTEQT